MLADRLVATPMLRTSPTLGAKAWLRPQCPVSDFSRLPRPRPLRADQGLKAAIPGDWPSSDDLICLVQEGVLENARRCRLIGVHFDAVPRMRKSGFAQCHSDPMHRSRHKNGFRDHACHQFMRRKSGRLVLLR